MDAIAPRRARSIEEWRELQGRMAAAEAFPEGIKSYRPRPTDIVITPFVERGDAGHGAHVRGKHGGPAPSGGD